MLQRSPTYILSPPGRDPLAPAAASGCPTRVALPDRAVEEHPDRARPATSSAAARPDVLQRLHPQGHRSSSCPTDVDVDVHFKPRYDPWDQRLCLVPDGDLFRALRHGTASIVTDTIETFTADRHPAHLGRGARGRPHRHRDRAASCCRSAASTSSSTASRSTPRRPMAYKALMLSGVPNFAYTIGYTNASWTLKADLVTDVRRAGCCAHLDEHGAPPGGRRSATRASASGRSWTSRPATCCARSTRLPRAGRPGAVAAASRTTSPTSARSGATPSTTACSTFALTRASDRLTGVRRTAIGTGRSTTHRRCTMGFDDKAENKGEDLKGQGKEAAGTATGDDELEAEGKATRPRPRSRTPARRSRTPPSDVKDGFKK